MTKKRERLILWIALEVLFIALVFIGSVYDFNITYTLSGTKVSSASLVHISNFMIKVLEIIGEWPAIIFSSFACCVIVRNIRKLVKKSNLALLFVALFDLAAMVLMFIGWYRTFKDVLGAVTGWHYAIIIPLALAFFFLVRYAVSKVSKETVKRFFVPAVVTVISAAVILVLIEGIKIVWGRTRLIEMIAANDVSKFTSWYVPNWFSGSKSFPSGHVGHSTLLFLIPIWFDKNAGDKPRRLTYLGVGIWLIAVGFSRLCAAAHFLTDITFGFAISFIVTQIATIKYEKSFMDKPVPKFIRTTEMTTSGITTGNIPQATTEQVPQAAKPAPQTETRSASRPTPAPAPVKTERSVSSQAKLTRESGESAKFIPKSQLKPQKKKKTLSAIFGFGKKKTKQPARPMAEAPRQAAGSAPARPAATVQNPAPTQARPVPAKEQPIIKPTQNAAAENVAAAMAASQKGEPRDNIADAPPPTLTSFSLDRARAEKAEREAAIVARNEAEAKKIDDGMKRAVTGEIKDISVPVEPKQKPAPKNTVKRKAPSKPGARKKTAPSDDSAVQMHFKFDSESNSLTSDISDD